MHGAKALFKIYTKGTKKLRDFNIAADIQGSSKFPIYVDMYEIEGILKTSTQIGKCICT